MTKPVAPIRLAAAEERAAWGGHRLQRILGRTTSQAPVSTLIDSLDPASSETWRSTWIDATSSTPVMHGDSWIALHILWSLPAIAAEVSAGIDPLADDGLHWMPVHPGDTVAVPPSTPFSIGRGTLAIAISRNPIRDGRSSSATNRPMLPPTHGLQVFRRYNRRTICLATPDLLLERWKLTGPIDFDLAVDRSHLLVNLVAPVGLVWAGGSDHAGRAETWLLPAGMDRITIVPDNLGYVLLAYIPDLAADAIAPLRAAGYDDASITSIGVPPDLLQTEMWP